MSNIGKSDSRIWQRPTVKNFEEIQNQCLKKKILFEDPEFDVIDSSLYYNKYHRKPLVVWLRPKEIAANPQFFVEGASRFDVKQGELGDCWLLAAVANLTLNKKLFDQVVPNDQRFDTKYAGIFHFRFWQYGKWVDVVVDDRLPTSDGKLLYLRSAMENEFWSALLEKAYAKVRGSYEALDEGNPMDAMTDFTGGVSETYKLNEAPPQLFMTMLDAYQRQSLMCGVIAKSQKPNPTTKGLRVHHAYSITKVTYLVTVTGKIPLVRIRNPWGDEIEWNGPWSDKSEEWLSIPESYKQSVGLIIDEDGEFWMSYKDFIKYFSYLQICNLTSYVLPRDQLAQNSKNMWQLSTFEGEWVRGATAGGCDTSQEKFSSNPQYHISIEDPDNDDEDMCTVIIALMQRGYRKKKLSIGFYVYDLNKSESTKPLDKSFFENHTALDKSFLFNSRETCKRFRVSPGRYCIVPFTSNENEEGTYLLRVFSEKKNNLAEFDNEVGMFEIDVKIKELALHTKKSNDSNEKLYKYFHKVAGSNKEVNWTGLKDILDYSMSQEIGTIRFSYEVCRCLISMMDWDRSGKLGFKEFCRLWVDIRQWKVVFKLYDKKNKGYIKGFELRPALNSIGYHLKTRIINTMCHRYANKKGNIMFDDFIMCAIRLKTTIGIFQDRDPENKKVASFTLDEWVEKTFYS